LPKT
jgi:hypothetical protein